MVKDEPRTLEGLTRSEWEAKHGKFATGDREADAWFAQDSYSGPFVGGNELTYVTDRKIDEDWEQRPAGEFGYVSAEVADELEVELRDVYEGGIVEGSKIDQGLRRPATDYGNVSYLPLGTKAEAERELERYSACS